MLNIPFKLCAKPAPATKENSLDVEPERHLDNLGNHGFEPLVSGGSGGRVVPDSGVSAVLLSVFRLGSSFLQRLSDLFSVVCLLLGVARSPWAADAYLKSFPLIGAVVLT